MQPSNRLACDGQIVEGWSTDSYKNFFGQMIVSDAKAFQSTLKMQLYDLPSSNFNLRVRQIFKHATCLDLH